jgi:hypothetical protein
LSGVPVAADDSGFDSNGDPCCRYDCDAALDSDDSCKSAADVCVSADESVCDAAEEVPASFDPADTIAAESGVIFLFTEAEDAEISPHPASINMTAKIKQTALLFFILSVLCPDFP